MALSRIKIKSILANVFVISGSGGVTSFNGRTGAVVLTSADIKTVNGISLLGTGNVVISGSGGGTFNPTSLQTGSYTAQASDLVLTDATLATVPITLPVTPADKTQIAVKMIAMGVGFTTTIAAGGSARFNTVSTGATSLTLTVLREAHVYQYQASTNLWFPIGDYIGVGQLDLRYLVASQNSTVAVTPRLINNYFNGIQAVDNSGSTRTDISLGGTVTSSVTTTWPSVTRTENYTSLGVATGLLITANGASGDGQILLKAIQTGTMSGSFSTSTAGWFENSYAGSFSGGAFAIGVYGKAAGTGFSYGGKFEALTSNSAATNYGAYGNATGGSVNVGGYFQGDGTSPASTSTAEGIRVYAANAKGGGYNLAVNVLSGSVQLSAGTATAKSAPLYFGGSGVLMTTPENYALEATSTHIYYTAGGVRYQLDQQSAGGNPPFNTITAATSANTAIDNTLFLQEWRWNSLVDGTGLLISSTATGSTASTQKLVSMTQGGANTNSAQKTVTLSLSNSKTGTTPQNVALDVPTGQVRLGAVGINSLSGVGAVNVGYLELADTNTPGISIGRSTSSYYSMFMSSAAWIFRGGSAGNNLWIIDGPTTGNQSWAQVIQSASNTAFTFTQSAHTGGTSTGWLFTGGAHTGQTTATEINDVIFNMARSVTRATGNVATDRSIRFQGRTNVFSGSSTVTLAANVSIGGIVAGNLAVHTVATAVNIETYAANSGTGTAGTAYGLIVNVPTGATNNYAANFGGKVLLTSTTTLAGLNFGSAASDPSVPTNGDAFYSTGTNTFRFYQNGAWVSLGTGGITFPLTSSQLTINNPAATFAYTFTSAAIAAARTITLPLLTGNDVMVTEAFTQTLSNKTLSSNTVAVTQSAGDNSTKIATTAYVDGLALGAFSTIANGYTNLSGSAIAVLLGNNSWTAPTVQGQTLRYNGTNTLWSVYEQVGTYSASATLPLTQKYISFTGTTAAQTLTLPAIAGNTGKDYIIKNRSTQTLVVSGPTASTVYDTAVVTTTNILAGQSLTFCNDGTYWTTN